MTPYVRRCLRIRTLYLGDGMRNPIRREGLLTPDAADAHAGKSPFACSSGRGCARSYPHWIAMTAHVKAIHPQKERDSREREREGCGPGVRSSCTESTHRQYLGFFPPSLPSLSLSCFSVSTSLSTILRKGTGVSTFEHSVCLSHEKITFAS